MAFPLRLPRRTDSGAFVEPFWQLAQHLLVGTDLLAELLNDDADHRQIASEVAAVNQQVDDVTRQIVRTIERSFVTAIDRDDLYALAQALASVMHGVDEAADLIDLYEIPALPKGFAKQITVLQRCAELTVEAMPRLTARRNLADYWAEVSRLEAAGNRHYRKLRAKLLAGSYKPLEVIKLSDISKALEGATNSYCQVATLIEQIVIKES